MKGFTSGLFIFEENESSLSDRTYRLTKDYYFNRAMYEWRKVSYSNRERIYNSHDHHEIQTMKYNGMSLPFKFIKVKGI